MIDYDAYEQEWQREHPCPKCGGPTTYMADCPGYPSKNRDGSTTIMVCYPACGNAYYYLCLSDECDWWYLHETHYRNTDGMGVRPTWKFIDDADEDDDDRE